MRNINHTCKEDTGIVRRRNLDQFKNDIMNIAKANKGNIVSVNEIRKNLFVTNDEKAIFTRAIEELAEKGKLKIHIGLP